MILQPGTCVLGYSRREDPRDALVLPEGIKELKPDGIIGTSSLRRSLQLKVLFPNCEIRPVRGNLQTRLSKLDGGQFDALALAAAGLIRLGLQHRICRYFDPEEIIPAAGQGILAVQGRMGEEFPSLQGYTDPDAALCARCERAFVKELDGGCTSPVCAHATLSGGRLTLLALYWDPETHVTRRGRLEGDAIDAEDLGRALARSLSQDKVN